MNGWEWLSATRVLLKNAKSEEQHMNKKFVLSALLSLTVVFVATAIIGGIKVKAEGDVIASGTCGEEATWTLDSDYKLIISGSGGMAESHH